MVTDSWYFSFFYFGFYFLHLRAPLKFLKMIVLSSKRKVTFTFQNKSFWNFWNEIPNLEFVVRSFPNRIVEIKFWGVVFGRTVKMGSNSQVNLAHHEFGSG